MGECIGLGGSGPREDDTGRIINEINKAAITQLGVLEAINAKVLEQATEIAKLKFINQKLSNDLEIQARINNLVYQALEGLGYDCHADEDTKDKIRDLEESLRTL